MIKYGLPPAIDNRTRILILGSLPSDISIRLQQYYANPGNDFWRLISGSIDEDIAGLDYDAKLEHLRAHGIGLWDVYNSGERDGSADSKIHSSRLNDFSTFKSISPRLSLVCFNGQKAGQHVEIFHKLGYDTVTLPSSSGANRRFSAKRSELWKLSLGLF